MTSMNKAMHTIQDLIEEAKVRTLWWALCIFSITYFLTNTSKSMWANAPIAILLVCALRILLQDLEFHRRARPVQRQTYLSYLEKKQLSLEDPRITNASPPSSKRRQKIDSPLVEAALNDFIKKVLQDFVVDLWYSEITPDKEAPEQMRILIIDVMGEIAGRLRDINLVDLLTRDIIDLVGKHFDLYRRNQSTIGIELMGTLSLEERDEKLKQHLMATKELHPALVSPENEYKVLQRLMGGLLAVVLRPQEAHSPVVRCIARELLTCLVIQPVLNLASPAYINEVIELVVQYAKDFLYAKDGNGSGINDDHLAGESNKPSSTIHTSELSSGKSTATSNQHNDATSAKIRNDMKTSSSPLESSREDHLQSQHAAGWGKVLEAATQRRSEVLAPENLENMWTKGRNYNTKRTNNVRARKVPPSTRKTLAMKSAVHIENFGKEMSPENLIGINDNTVVQVNHGPCLGRQCSDGVYATEQSFKYLNKGQSFEGTYHAEESEDYDTQHANENKARLKRSSSTSDLNAETDTDKMFSTEGDGAIYSEFYSPEFGKLKEDQHFISSNMEFCREGILNVPKLRCRVVGAYFENIGSTSFAVYSIAVTDACNNTWFVKRRYRNFERLHRHLKDIPNYTMHLPPKRFLSSSIDDSFVHQRCIQLDQYLQDLLSIANIAEQHEVWDFLSASSKNYAFGRSTSVMKTLAVNVDDAMDDILRQVKGVSDGLMRKVVGSSSIPCPPSPPPPPLTRHITWNGNESSKQSSSYNELETSHSLSDNEEHHWDGNQNSEEIISGLQVNEWHSDNELDLKDVLHLPRVIKSDEDAKVRAEKDRCSEATFHMNGPSPGAISLITSGTVEDPVEAPPEWTPPNVSVPMLNLVDKIFQLSRRGWLRRQVFWFSKQILQVVMEDAIDDFLLRQIQYLRRDDTIALGIRWIQDVLWPGGTFFLKLSITQRKVDDTRSTVQAAQASKLGSFEEQLEAVRRANDVKKMIFEGAPTALVSLIGHKQYKRSARDIYYFIQSNICVKQLTYEVLELLLITVFPELRDLIINIHEKM